MRSFALREIDFHPRFNVLLGKNGCGKTTVLESINMLSLGRSFRTQDLDECISNDDVGVGVVAQVSDRKNSQQDFKLKKYRGQSVEVTLCGQRVYNNIETARSLPIMRIDATSLSLLNGPPSERRNLMNACSFYISEEFTHAWTDFRHALRQRNACLKTGDDSLGVWNDLMCEKAQLIYATWEKWGLLFEELLREHLANSEHPLLQSLLTDIELQVHPGFGKYPSLADALLASEERDTMTGYTAYGPHRGDFSLFGQGQSKVRMLSSGEQKLLATQLLFTQGVLLRQHAQSTVVYLIDDPAAELDANALSTLLNQALYASIHPCTSAKHSYAQVLLTGIDDTMFKDVIDPENSHFIDIEQ